MIHGDLSAQTSFSDHLQGLVDDYTAELISKRRQLRDTQKVLQELRIEFWNYKLSWVMDQAELEELRDMFGQTNQEKRRLTEKNNKLAEEYAKLTKSFNEISEENKLLKNRERRRGTGRSSRTSQSSVEGEERRNNVPRAPQSEVKGQRRPYTGRSREASRLPPISDNNNVVRSPSSNKGHSSPVHLPPTGSTSPKLVPSPPKCPPPSRSTSGRQQSRIPLAFPPVPGAAPRE